MTLQPIPEIADIEAAAHRISGFAVRTPLIESPVLNALAGGRILLKAECLQRTGSFKFRGAWNKISQLDPKIYKGGVVAYSSGNHAQGVAAAARIRNFPALIVMPADTPLIKQNNTRQLGADTVLYDRARESREAIALALCKERGA
ncbi:MAG: threonine ammonia-lyase, partial [Aestuariivirgaceae bacterium]